MVLEDHKMREREGKRARRKEREKMTEREIICISWLLVRKRYFFFYEYFNS